MKRPEPIYCIHYGAPSYHREHLGDWPWKVRDGMTGPVLAEGHALTEWGAHRAIERVVRCCVPISGVCRYDLPVLHPLKHWEMNQLNARLEDDGVPVTVRIDNPAGEVVLWPALELTTQQQAHTLHVVKRVTDAPVHWAGVA